MTRVCLACGIVLATYQGATYLLTAATDKAGMTLCSMVPGRSDDCVTMSEDEFQRAGGQLHSFPGVRDANEAADLLRLGRMNDAHVADLVRDGRRLSGTGFLPALGTNILNFYWDDRWFTCGDQAVAFLSKMIESGARMDAATNSVRPGDGWAYEIGTSWPNHAFVVATSPTGARYRVDPWYGTVEKMSTR